MMIVLDIERMTVMVMEEKGNGAGRMIDMEGVLIHTVGMVIVTVEILMIAMAEMDTEKMITEEEVAAQTTISMVQEVEALMDIETEAMMMMAAFRLGITLIFIIKINNLKT